MIVPVAQAASWDPIVASDDGLLTFYGDPASLVVRGPMRTLRLLYDYRLLQQDSETFIENRSTIAVTAIDCQSHKLAGVQSTSYAKNMGKGSVVEKSVTLAESDLHYVAAVPGSIDDKVVSYVCAMRRSVGNNAKGAALKKAEPAK